MLSTCGATGFMHQQEKMADPAQTSTLDGISQAIT